MTTPADAAKGNAALEAGIDHLIAQGALPDEAVAELRPDGIPIDKLPWHDPDYKPTPEAIQAFQDSWSKGDAPPEE